MQKIVQLKKNKDQKSTTRVCLATSRETPRFVSLLWHAERQSDRRAVMTATLKWQRRACRQETARLHRFCRGNWVHCELKVIYEEKNSHKSSSWVSIEKPWSALSFKNSNCGGETNLKSEVSIQKFRFTHWCSMFVCSGLHAASVSARC